MKIHFLQTYSDITKYLFNSTVATGPLEPTNTLSYSDCRQNEQCRANLGAGSHDPITEKLDVALGFQANKTLTRSFLRTGHLSAFAPQSVAQKHWCCLQIC